MRRFAWARSPETVRCRNPVPGRWAAGSELAASGRPGFRRRHGGTFREAEFQPLVLAVGPPVGAPFKGGETPAA
jgi:hypothetical protein